MYDDRPVEILNSLFRKERSNSFLVAEPRYELQRLKLNVQPNVMSLNIHEHFQAVSYTHLTLPTIYSV